MQSFAGGEKEIPLRLLCGGIKKVKSYRISVITATQHSHTLWVFLYPTAQYINDLEFDSGGVAVYPAVEVRQKFCNEDSIVVVESINLYWLRRWRWLQLIQDLNTKAIAIKFFLY